LKTEMLLKSVAKYEIFERGNKKNDGHFTELK